MLDGAMVFLCGAIVGAGWTYYLAQRLEARFAEERAKHVKERDTVLRALGQIETRLQEYEHMADIPPEEM